MKKTLLSAPALVSAVIIFFAAPACAVLDLIDIPTADVNEKYSMELNFRLYSGGGTVSRVSFGVFPQLTIGCTLDIVSLIGSEQPTFRSPVLNMKLKVFQGAKNLPSVALGYDGQGYRYDDAKGEYTQKERGLYLVANSEALTSNLQLYFGASANMKRETDRDRADIFGFLGASYPLLKEEREIICFLAEFDNLFRSMKDNRYNTGIKIFPVENFDIGIFIKDISSQSGIPVERSVKITYLTQF